MISTKRIPIICFTLCYVITNNIATANSLIRAEATGTKSSNTEPTITKVAQSGSCYTKSDQQGGDFIECYQVSNTFPDSEWYNYRLPLICWWCYVTNFSRDSFPYDNKITILNLTDGELSYVEDYAFRQFTSCEAIDLSHNQIKTIADYTFAPFKENLKELYLQWNKIRYLSAEMMAPLGNLEVLNLAHNQLISSSLQESINTSTLKVLDLSYNNIGTIDRYSFLNLANLEELNLEGNAITSLEPLGMFQHMSSLTQLNLIGNLLTTLPIGTFSGLTQLRELKLANNRLKEFTGKELIQSFTVDDVDISGNNISFISGNSLYAGAPTLKYIHLDGNFFYCDSLVETLEFFKDKGVQFPVDRGEYEYSNIAGISCVDGGPIPAGATTLSYKQNVIRSLFAVVGVIVLFFR